MWSPIGGYAGLLRLLRGRRFNLVEFDRKHPEVASNFFVFAYDWRLSNRYNARLLAKKVEDLLSRWRSLPGKEDARLVLVCHSMGGLVARWFLEHENGAELTRSLITIGTPHRGATRALGTLVNGIAPGVGRLRLDLTGMVRSMPSLHQLLPTFDCLELPGGKRTSLTGVGIPGVGSKALADAAKFHADLRNGGSPYTLHKIVGIRQPTVTTARIVAGQVILSEEIDNRNQGGDGTVPRLSAEPVAGRGSEVHEVAEHHGELHNTRSALDLIDGILSREDVVWQRGVPGSISAVMPELCAPDEAPEVTIRDLDDRRLQVSVTDETGSQVGQPVVVRPDGRAMLEPLPPGGYLATVGSDVAGGPEPVRVPFLVWDPAVSQLERTIVMRSQDERRTASRPGGGRRQWRVPHAGDSRSSSSRQCQPRVPAD